MPDFFYNVLMGESFRSDDVNQSLLQPPSLHDWLPGKHLARFLVDVVETLNLRAVHASYGEKDGRDQSAYAPAMMVRVLLYGYTTGTYSSRKIQEHAGGVSQAAFAGYVGAVYPGAQVVPEGRIGEVGPCGHRRDQTASQRQQTQGDELWAHGRGGEKAEG